MQIYVRKIDSQGRISLPSEWRKKLSTNEILIFYDGETLILKPKQDFDLTKHFDSIAADINPEDFEDYHRLKRVLLSREQDLEIR
ncbi:MAG: AbrB/MazE/SpoVT family DNA-binding domain-containing protein [Candidatus Heimdallarchaeota archaeon]